jgi:hypothetical protein
LAWLGLAWLGLAWLGLAWLGLAWLGLAWPLHSLLRIQSMKMELILGSETSTHFNQTPGLHPKENTLHQQHGESLKTKSKLG